MLPPSLAQLSAVQHGVFTYVQARTHGLTSDDLRYRCRTAQLGRIRPGIYRVLAAPESWHQRVMAAALSVSGGLASHRSAAMLWKLDGVEHGPIEVVTPHGGWRRRDIRLHQSTDLKPADHDQVDGVPCTSLVRTLVDLPAVLHEFRCGQALDHACRNDRTVLSQVADRHLEVARRGRNGTVALRAILERRGAGGRVLGSGFEAKALHLIAMAGLPEPTPQWQVRNGGFVSYIDLAWPESLVGVECDSLAHHFGERAHQADRTRRRQLTLLGWTMLEFTYEDVTQRGPLVVAQIRAALAA